MYQFPLKFGLECLSQTLKYSNARPLLFAYTDLYQWFNAVQTGEWICVFGPENKFLKMNLFYFETSNFYPYVFWTREKIQNLTIEQMNHNFIFIVWFIFIAPPMPNESKICITNLIKDHCLELFNKNCLLHT